MNVAVDGVTASPTANSANDANERQTSKAVPWPLFALFASFAVPCRLPCAARGPAPSFPPACRRTSIMQVWGAHRRRFRPHTTKWATRI